MLKRLIVGLISVTLLFQSLVFSSPVYASPVITTENYQAVYEIPFSDTILFYKKLNQALKSSEPIVIQTDFKSYEEFPEKLKKIVKIDDPSDSMDRVASIPGGKATTTLIGGAAVAGAATGLILPLIGVTGADSLIASGWLDYKALNFMIWTAIGAGIGFLIGAPEGGITALPASAIGGVVGATASIVSQAFNDSSHRVILAIGLDRTLKVIIEPASSVA